MRLLLLLLLVLVSCSDDKKSEVKNYNSEAYQVAFLIMDGVYNTELTAPWDVFEHTKYRDGIKRMEVFTIAEHRQMIRTSEGLNIRADYGFNDPYPPIDVLVIPSAESHLNSALTNEKLLNFVRSTDSNATWVTSHCDGAFLLGAAGVLKGKYATTFPADLTQFEERFPKVKVVHDKIVVQDGKYISSAGGAKSFEAALYLIHILYGEQASKGIAEGLVLDWNEALIDSLIFVKKD